MLGIVFLLEQTACYVIRVNAIDPALRRSGRFDTEVEVTVPTVEERLQILKVVFDFFFFLKLYSFFPSLCMLLYSGSLFLWLLFSLGIWL